MNKQRREELLGVTSLLDDALDELNDIQNEEEEAFDNLPEGLQNSKTGDNMQTAIDTLQDFATEIESVKTKMEKYAQNKK